MTSPRSSPTLRSHRVENLQRGKGKRQKLNAADIAECTNPDQNWYQLAVSKDDDLRLLKIELCKVVKSFIKLDYIHAVYKEKQGKKCCMSSDFLEEMVSRLLNSNIVSPNVVYFNASGYFVKVGVTANAGYFCFGMKSASFASCC